jgi:hypothetical protein
VAEVTVLPREASNVNLLCYELGDRRGSLQLVSRGLSIWSPRACLSPAPTAAFTISSRWPFTLTEGGALRKWVKGERANLMSSWRLTRDPCAPSSLAQ